MDDLPELPFEQVLSYLNLEDRLKARTVSRAWRNTFDRYPPKTLCYSSSSSDFIFGKNRWISGAFAQNFISFARFVSFFDTFGQTILSSLKRLRLCDLDLRGRDRKAFTRTLNSFHQLEYLDIIRTQCNSQRMFNLNLPMLTSLHLEKVFGIKKLTLEAPRLREVTILDYYQTDLRVEIVHGEPVERLLVDHWEFIEVKNLKNLQYLYVNYLPDIDSTFLSSLRQLKEFHTNEPLNVSELFKQKQRYGLADLKIYLFGLLLNSPDDPAINALDDSNPYYLKREWLVFLAENPSRQADQIPFYHSLHYFDIEDVVSVLEVDVLKRFTDFNKLIVNRPVQDTQRFLDFLKNFENFAQLKVDGDQPQDLFDRLPEHCAVQKLTVYHPPSDLAFLFRLKHLIKLVVTWSIDNETVRRAFELPVLSSFSFRYGQKSVSIEISQSKRFQVSVDDRFRSEKVKTFSDLNTAIKFIFGFD